MEKELYFIIRKNDYITGTDFSINNDTGFCCIKNAKVSSHQQFINGGCQNPKLLEIYTLNQF
jgi:hypothetical protein